MSQPPSRTLPTRYAAARAADKIKANLEQVRAWDAKDFEESNLNFSVSDHFKQKAGAVDGASTKGLKRQRGEDFEDKVDVCEDPDDQLSYEGTEASMGSTATLLSSSGGTSTSVTDESKTESHAFMKCKSDKVSFSDVRRRERAAKAHARSHHSSQRMFLSRRLSRQMRGCRSPRSPIFSPLVATALIFSPEWTPHPKVNKEKRHKQKAPRQSNRPTVKSPH
jgi:hypothetical protein